MKIPIYILGYIGKNPHYKKIILDFKGRGTRDDPIIIEPAENIPQSFDIRDLDLFINIRNCELQALSIDSCQNIKLENCIFKIILLKNCLGIDLKSIRLTKYLKLGDCLRIKIEDCIIKNLSIYHYNFNVIKNCVINKIKEVRSKENVFESIKIPEG